MIDLSDLLTVAIEASRRACGEILAIYEASDFQTEAKPDNSPITLADRNAHRVIAEILATTGIPVLSEEGKNIPYDERKNWSYFWLVDPLDGTKEFLKRNGEFTVNIALVRKHEPILGVVAVPVSGDVFAGGKGLGAYILRNGERIDLNGHQPVDFEKPGIRVVASRTHMDSQTAAFIEKLNNPVLMSRGSSLKFMLLAEGLADVYPRFAPTMEWDTGAAQAILNELGIRILQQGTTDPLVYNKSNLLNPGFLCF
ncbi:MAG: 3'(2'),5'-bisphosphate nucleotidase CysQ [Cyclobacteriaceae bacterium]|jgi:3'(2'), 5'-bisphosphate nucleotidase|nr:3'(2'),5'-bisphosphate nucleotidase CysQ [Cyclobacteriaceae bacterium]